MKINTLFIPVFLFLSITLSAQQTVTRTVGPFTRIEVKNGIRAELVKSDKESVEINVRDIEPSDVLTDLSEGLLKLSVDAPALSKYDVAVRIYYKKLREITGSGQSEISTAKLMKQDSLTVNLVSGAKAYLSLDIGYLKCKAVEGAALTADGYAVVQDSYTSTGATLSLFDLESDEITIKGTANGKAKINVEKKLNADSSTGAYITYKGDPGVVNTNTSIGGKIEKFTE